MESPELDPSTAVAGPPMPTRVGDVVILHRDLTSPTYLIWAVTEHRQQLPDAAAPTTYAIGWNAAVVTARIIAARSGGGVFALEWGTGTWTEIT